MKKTILAVTAAAFVSAAAFTPTPASAFVWIALPAVLAIKKDPNFKPVNPYAAKATVSKRSKRR